MKKEWIIFFALLGALFAYSRYKIHNKAHTHQHSCGSCCGHSH